MTVKLWTISVWKMFTFVIFCPNSHHFSRRILQFMSEDAVGGVKERSNTRLFHFME